MKKILIVLAVFVLILSLVSCGTDSSKQTVPASDKQTITGIYEGLADNNTYEVKLSENTYKMLMITDDIRTGFEKLNLKKGDKVEVTYLKTQSAMLQTVTIRLAGKQENKDPDTVTGKYVGLADNNFFEVLIDNSEEKEYKVFMITDAVRTVFEKLDLKKNDAVSICYSANDAGQLEVTSIEKLD